LARERVPINGTACYQVETTNSVITNSVNSALEVDRTLDEKNVKRMKQSSIDNYTHVFPEAQLIHTIPL